MIVIVFIVSLLRYCGVLFFFLSHILLHHFKEAFCFLIFCCFKSFLPFNLTGQFDFPSNPAQARYTIACVHTSIIFPFQHFIAILCVGNQPVGLEGPTDDGANILSSVKGPQKSFQFQ